MSTTETVLVFRVPPQPNLSRVVRDGVGAAARGRGLREDDLQSFMTALGEALANAMEHAKAEQPIDVEVSITADRIVATVEDSGVGFRPLPPPEPRLPDALAERGRGLPIMQKCSDIFAVSSRPGEGTVVVVGRYLNGRDSSAGAA